MNPFWWVKSQICVWRINKSRFIRGILNLLKLLGYKKTQSILTDTCVVGNHVVHQVILQRRVRSRAVPCVASGSRPLHSTLFIARQARSDLLRCKCSHPHSHDRLIQIPLYFMLQYCSLGYQWERINNPAVLLVYSSGRPRPIVIQVAIRELSQRLGRGWDLRFWVFSRTSRVLSVQVSKW